MSDEFDNASTSDNIAVDSAGTSATADVSSPAPAATSETSTPSSVDAAASTGPADAATQTSTDGSLENPNTTLQAAKPVAAQPAVNYEQRYGELRKREQQLFQQNQRYQEQLKQFQGVDPSQVRQYQEQQRRAQTENLPPWNRQHPANARFNEAKIRWGQYKSAIQRAETPEQKQWVKETLGSQFAQEDVSVIQAWESHQRNFAEGFASDPEGSIGEIVDRRVQEALNKHVQTAQAQQSVGQWFDDQANKPLIERFGSEMMSLMQGGATFEVAKKWAKQQQQLDGLQSRVGDASKIAANASEQSRLLKGAAAVTHDPKTNAVVDPMAVARKRGIQPGTGDYFDLLIELKEQGL